MYKYKQPCCTIVIQYLFLTVHARFLALKNYLIKFNLRSISCVYTPVVAIVQYAGTA